MRVSLLNPDIRCAAGLERVMFTEPLGLECVAAVLEDEGHQCQIVDLRLDGTARGMAKVRRFMPDLVGVQSSYTSQRSWTLSIIESLRSEHTGVPIVVGGHDASMDASWLTNSGVSAVVVGEGERTMPALVRTYETAGDPGDVPGLILLTPDGPVCTGSAPSSSIDNLPLPARHLIDEYAGRYHVGFFRPLALVETSRGCPYRCSFCSVWKFHGGKYRQKSPDRVIRELAQIKPKTVFVTDDTFCLTTERDWRIIRAIREAGITKEFIVQTRTDIVVKHPDLIEAWRDCGLNYVFLGIEKIDDKGLESIAKSNTIENNERSIEILRGLGVRFALNFIVDPGWTHEQFENLRSWVNRTGSYNSFSILTPLPGTDIWESEKHRVSTGNWNLFDFEHSVLPTKLTLEDFYKEYAHLWRHSFAVQRRARGRFRVCSGMLSALADRRTSLTEAFSGLKVARALSRHTTFLAGHRASTKAHARDENRALDRSRPAR